MDDLLWITIAWKAANVCSSIDGQWSVLAKHDNHNSNMIQLRLIPFPFNCSSSQSYLYLNDGYPYSL